MRRFLILLIAVVILFFPILFGGRIFTNGDLFHLIYPTYEFYHSALNHGESFLWNPYILGGFPFPASVLGIFSPVGMLLFKYFPTMTAYHLILFINVLFAAFFLALLLKNFGLGLVAQVVGAITFAVSGWHWTPDIGIVSAYPILPLLFLMLWKAREKTWPLWAGGAVVGYGFLTAHYNWLAMILVASFIFALFLGRTILFKFLGMILLGVIPGAIQILPGYFYSQFSARATNLSFSDSAVGTIGIFDLPRLFLPNFILPGVPVSESLLYFGVIPLFFALLAFGLKDKLVRFFAGTLVLTFLIAIKYSPLFWAIHKLPVFSGFRGPSRWMFIGLFAASILAAFGLDRMTEISQFWKKTTTYIVTIIGFITLAVALASGFMLNIFRSDIISFLKHYFQKNYYSQTSQLPLSHYEEVIENYFNQTAEIFDFSNPVFLFSMIFLFVSILVIMVLYTGSREISKQVLALIIIFNFILVFILFLPTVSRQVFVPNSSTAAALDKNWKVFTFLSGFSEWTKLTVPHGANLIDSLELNAELLTPNVNIVYQVTQADAYENLMPRRNARLLALLGSDRATTGEKLSEQKVTPEEKAKIFAERKYLLDILGVRYITSVYVLDESRFTKISERKVTDHEIPVYLYENKTAKSLVYFAEKVQKIKPDELEAYNKIVQMKDANITLWECKSCPEISEGDVGKIEIISQTNTKVVIHVKTNIANLLVFSQNHLPGWRSFVDGRETPIFTTNSVFMGIVVPEGEHGIEFSYAYPKI